MLSYCPEKAVTRLPRGLEASSIHQGVLKYQIGERKRAVRFEADASYDDPETVGESEPQIPESQSDGEEIASLATAFSSMGVYKTDLGPTGGSADMIGRGPGTEQANIAELKSKRDHRSRPKPPILRIYASTSGKGPLPASVVKKFWNKRMDSVYCFVVTWHISERGIWMDAHTCAGRTSLIS